MTHQRTAALRTRAELVGLAITVKYNPNIVKAYFESCGLPPAVTEHTFHPLRKWRFDFAWVDCKVALEVEGGIWSGGGHNRGKGFSKDIEKYNAAAMAGWIVLRCVPAHVAMLDTVRMIEVCIASRLRVSTIPPRRK